MASEEGDSTLYLKAKLHCYYLQVKLHCQRLKTVRHTYPCKATHLGKAEIKAHFTPLANTAAFLL